MLAGNTSRKHTTKATSQWLATHHLLPSSHHCITACTSPMPAPKTLATCTLHYRMPDWLPLQSLGVPTHASTPARWANSCLASGQLPLPKKRVLYSIYPQVSLHLGWWVLRKWWQMLLATGGRSWQVPHARGPPYGWFGYGLGDRNTQVWPQETSSSLTM